MPDNSRHTRRGAHTLTNLRPEIRRTAERGEGGEASPRRPASRPPLPPQPLGELSQHRHEVSASGTRGDEAGESRTPAPRGSGGHRGVVGGWRRFHSGVGPGLAERSWPWGEPAALKARRSEAEGVMPVSASPRAEEKQIFFPSHIFVVSDELSEKGMFNLTPLGREVGPSFSVPLDFAL